MLIFTAVGLQIRPSGGMIVLTIVLASKNVKYGLILPLLPPYCHKVTCFNSKGYGSVGSSGSIE